MDTKSPQDELRASPIVTVGTVSSILLFILVVGFSALFLYVENQAVEKASPLLLEEVRCLKSQQMGEINSYRWISQKEGIVRIPVERP